jgi:long-subunit acyl-CoA synthetase (AMP-forming)
MEFLKPSILPGVPRLFSRIFQKVMQGKDQKGGIAKFLFDLGYTSKQAILEEGNGHIFPMGGKNFQRTRCIRIVLE